MDEDVKKVVKGFLNLTDNQRKEFIETVSDLDKYPNLAKEKIRKSIGTESLSETRKFSNNTSVNFGPKPGGGCPCCGG